MMLAQTVVEIPLDQTTKTLVGLCGVLMLGLGVVMFWYYCKKLFGKHPPLHEELRAVRVEFREGDDRLEKKIGNIAREHAELCPFPSFKKEVDERFEGLRLERMRSDEKMHQKLNGINRNVYLIAGRLGVKTAPNSDEHDL